MADETYTKNEDGSLSIKSGEENPVRWVKESDLLAVKGSRDELQKKVDTASTEATASTAANTAAAEESRQAVIKAEARVDELDKQIKAGGGTAAELVEAKTALQTAKTSGEELGVKLLELRRAHISTAYGVPRATVDAKNLVALDTYEEALKDVLKDKGLGKFAVNVGSGGNTLEGKSPRELATLAYTK